MDIIASLHSALSADAALSLLLDDDGGSPAGPAIFSGDELPAGYPRALPCVWIRAPHVSRPVDVFSGHFSRSIELDVSLYAIRSQSSKAIDDAAERARVVLHRATLSDGEQCTVSGPTVAPVSGETIAGRRLSVAIFAKD
jgi:hypothetical protein